MGLPAWHPTATRNLGRNAGRFHSGYGWKLLVHTTEAAGKFRPRPNSYFGHSGYPHFTLDRTISGPAGVYQHVPLDRAARALRPSRRTQTNRGRVIQVECMAHSSADPDSILSDDQVEWLQGFFWWMAGHVDIKPVALPAGRISGSARTGAPQRLTPAQWRDFSGVLGHRHAPANTHWDPGAFDLTRIIQPLADSPPPQQQRNEEEMAQIVNVHGDLYRTSGVTAVHIGRTETLTALGKQGERVVKWDGPANTFVDSHIIYRGGGTPLPRKATTKH